MRSESALPDFLPLVPPSRHGHLAVEAPHAIYWEERGARDAPPALVVHGGRGSGTGDKLRPLCDPGRLRAIVFDQRVTGSSRPFGALDGVMLAASVADIERLRAVFPEAWQRFAAYMPKSSAAICSPPIAAACSTPIPPSTAAAAVLAGLSLQRETAPLMGFDAPIPFFRLTPEALARAA